MLPTRRNIHEAPTKEVIGDFPVYFHYTAGIAGEKFLYGLKDQKILGNTCPSCNHTYVPTRMFCEDCFEELGDETYKEVGPEGELFSFTEVFVDHRGDMLKEPYFLGLIKIKGTNTTFFHRLVGIDNPSIGMIVKPMWNQDRKGSIFDLKGFSS